jgi:uncharacterized membrane-anchored protein
VARELEMLAQGPVPFTPISLRVDPRTTEQKLADLQGVIRGYESVVVAFSAGADSTLVAGAGRDVRLGEPGRARAG